MATAQVRVPEQSLTEWSGFDGLVQLISVDGQRTVGCPYWDLVADVDAAQLRDLYTDMAVVRRLDAEAMALQRQGELALWAPLLGQEAAQVGSARALRPDDFVFPSYREHGVAYCRGVDPVAMLRLWRGTGLSGWDPAAFGIATPAIVVGSQALHATGYALGHHARRRRLGGADLLRRRRHQRGRRGRGPRLRRQLHGARRLLLPEQPVGHLGAGPPAVARLASPSAARGTASPGSRSTATTSWPCSPPPGWRSARAYAGQGPTLIEAVTYRMGPHTTSDDPTRYRTRAEEEEWRAKDPLTRLRRAPARRGTGRRRFRVPCQRCGRGRGGGPAPWLSRHGRPRTGRALRPCLRRPAPACSRRSATAYADYLAGFDEEP